MNIALNFLDTYDTSSKTYTECITDCTTLMTKLRAINNEAIRTLILKTYATFSGGDPLSNPLLDRCKSPLFAVLCRDSSIHIAAMQLIASQNQLDVFDLLLDVIRRSPFQELVQNIYAVIKVLSDDMTRSDYTRTRLLELRDETVNLGKTEAFTYIGSLLNTYSQSCPRPAYVIDNDEDMSDVISRLRTEISNKIVTMQNLEERIKAKILVLVTDSEIGRCLGPLNPKLDLLDHENDDYVCAVFGCRMLTCNCLNNIDEDEDDPEEDWFRGLCDRCHMHIESPSHATRIPLTSGSWRGCFCSTGSFDCIRQYVNECNIINGLQVNTYMNPLSRVLEALNDTSLLEYTHTSH